MHSAHDPISIKPSLNATVRTNLRPAVFFDRDGVLNIDYGYVDTPARLKLVDNAAASVRACREAGLLVFVVTNQSGIARGYFDEPALQRLHDHLREMLAQGGALIDDIRFCPHHENAILPQYRCDCTWRKPGPGMIFDLAQHWPVDLSRSFLIGDNESDMEAAAAAGIAGFRFTGGDLLAFVRPILDEMRVI